ncbi:sirohydrochlorin cobaltochelatase [Hathewaya histolytica]|uniref:sirohydrochlorin cobaltochelatase n=1 Tax=Hathewaya histolytica TaxID=1498 RepID=UPI003B678244
MKKAILVVSFGTSYEDTRKLTIEAIENKVKETYGDYEVRRAFTSHIIIRKLKRVYDMHVDTPEEALEKLKNEGFEEVIVQPLHLIPGVEFDYIKKILTHGYKDAFKRIEIGRPLIYFKGEEEGHPDDYTLMVDAIKEQIKDHKNILFMGHGTSHYSNAVYSCFQCVLHDEGIRNVYIANVEGYPYINTALERMKVDGVKEVTLMPFMLVAGDHAQNDMAGDDEDSYKSILEAEGMKVNIYMHGLGENKKIQDLYLQHLDDAIEGRYKELGKNQKGMK